MSKPNEPDHPMQLSGVQLPGDVALMIDSIVEEYAGIGWGERRILQIFAKPFFQSTFALARRIPEEHLRGRIRAVLTRCGVVRVDVTEAEPIADEEIELVQIASRRGDAKGATR